MNEQNYDNENQNAPVHPVAPAPVATTTCKPWRRRTTAGIAALAIAGAAGLGGIAVGQATAGTSTNSSAASGGLWTQPNNGEYQPGGGFNGSGTDGSGTDGGSSTFGDQGGSSTFGTEGTTDTSGTEASQSQQTGVVTIDTVVDYGEARAAGSGIVLTSDGVILTNHHVVDGATQIKVTVETTGKTYTAEVVGTDATNDVAVLKLQDASGLATAKIDDDGNLKVGDAITTVGNAEGRGVLIAAKGAVTALDQSITAGSEAGGAGERLTGLIQADVDVVSGDSGGAMLDAEGEVVGMTTAASTGTANITGYAIDIDKAVAIADQIEAGQETGSASDTVHIGASAFLGVTLSGTTSAATIGGTVEDSPAAEAGLAAGDTITAVDGAAIGSATALSTALAEHKPGDEVKITWTDTAGESHTATVTLVEGPVA